MSFAKTAFCLGCKTTTRGELHKFLMRSGADTFIWICSVCKRRNPFGDAIFISKEKVQGHLTAEQIEALPVVMPDASNRCVRCGERFCEMHHWAPRAIFGQTESDKWPKDYLCKTCHDAWHEMVTPQLRRK